MSLGVLDLFELYLTKSKSKSIIIVSNHRIGLERLGNILNFVMLIAGILVCMHRPKDGITLGLCHYRDDFDQHPKSGVQ